MIERTCDLAWFRGLLSCLVQRIMILLGSEDYNLAGFRGFKSCLVQRIMILLRSEDYDLAWFRGL